MRQKTVVKATDAILLGDATDAKVGPLVDSGWLVKTEDGALGFGPACGDVIGVSINRESLEWVVAGPVGRLAEGQLDAEILPLEGNKTASTAELEKRLTEVLCAAKPHLLQKKIGGIGVAWPGPIAPEGEPRDYPYHHSGVRDQAVAPSSPLTPIVEGALSAAKLSAVKTASGEPPIAIINDADADMLFELRHGVAKGVTNAMGVKVCGGIGISLLQGGRLVRGGHGSAGEVEHVRVRVEEEEPLDWAKLVPLEELPTCSCTGKECVGRFATGAAIVKQLVNYLDEERLTPTQQGRRIEAQPSQAVIRDVFNRAGSLLGQALVGPALAFDPEVLFVTAFPRNEALVTGLRTKLTNKTPTYLREKDVIGGTVGQRTTAIGAAQLIIEEQIVPRIDREAPSGSKPVKRSSLPWWLRQEVPAEVKELDGYLPRYGTLRQREKSIET